MRVCTVGPYHIGTYSFKLLTDSHGVDIRIKGLLLNWIAGIALQLIHVHPVIAMFLFREYRRHGEYAYCSLSYSLNSIFTILTYDESIEINRK